MKKKILNVLRDLRTPCIVRWKDIFSKVSEDQNIVEDQNIDDLLVVCDTYGIIYKVTDKSVMVVTEDSNLAVDYTVIPISNILEVVTLKVGDTHVN